MDTLSLKERLLQKIFVDSQAIQNFYSFIIQWIWGCAELLMPLKTEFQLTIRNSDNVLRGYVKLTARHFLVGLESTRLARDRFILGDKLFG